MKSPSTIHATASKGQYPQHSIVDRDERFARWFTTSLKPYFSLIDPSHVSTSKCIIIHLVQATKRNFKLILHLDKMNLSYSLECCNREVRWVYLHCIRHRTWADGPNSDQYGMCNMIYFTVNTKQNVQYLTSYFVSFSSLRCL